MSNQIYGWFSEASLDTPVHDPPHDAPCLLCGESIFEADVRTISLMWGSRADGRGYFYRVHKTCHQHLNEDEQNRLDGWVLDMIGRNG